MIHNNHFQSRVVSSLFVAFLCSSSSALLAQDAGSVQRVYEHVSPATVLIKTGDGAASGFIVRSNGTIVTAFHVVDGADRVAVKTKSGEIFDNDVLLAKDGRRDIAIIKVPGFQLPAVDLGNSNELQPGQHIIVIGNPLGLEELRATVTDGIISGIRDFGSGYRVIEITAAISPGNSGGPALNDQGKVIGVAVFKLVSGESLNFAVPINYVRGLLESVRQVDPIKKWESASALENVFDDKEAKGFSGYWKSSSGNSFYLRDHGDQVKVVNLSGPHYTYDLRWEESLILGFIYDRGGRSGFVIKKVDDDHLHVRVFKIKKNWDRTRLLAEGKKKTLKNQSIWIKMR